MKHKLEPEFYQISKKIVSENKTVVEWAKIESDDMFQSDIYEGGFDSTGMYFSFCVFLNSKEYWFQLTLDEIIAINNKQINEVNIEEADW